MKNLCLTFVLFFSLTKGFASGTIVGVSYLSSINVGLYEKFEIGVQLSDVYSNPYDPDIVSLEATFTSPSGVVHNVNGFYYKELKINDSYQGCDASTNDYDQHWTHIISNSP